MEKRSAGFVFIFSLLMHFSFLFLPVAECGRAAAMFVFGDSLLDNGNNNFIPTIARANYLPYGIDYGIPTGRFCNGLTVTDYGAKQLGLPFPAPYLSLQSKMEPIMQGFNYASAAAGILDATGRHYGARITLNGQIALFEKTVTMQHASDIMKLLNYVGSSIFVINVGSNDYINNYLLPDLYASSRDYTHDAFADLLIKNFEGQLTNLYRLGARKMVVVGIGPLGCIPSQLFQHNSTDGSCVGGVNEQVSSFNNRLKSLVANLSSTLPGSFPVYHNIYDTFMGMIQKPARYGFREKNQACCGNGRFGGQVSCLPLQIPCLNRDEFIFWDSFHPTEAANEIIADGCYSPSATDCRPISAYRLAHL